MFKVGQVWRSAKGKMVRVIGFKGDFVFVELLNGPKQYCRGWVRQSTVINGYQVIGNNYQARQPPEQRGCRKEDC